MGKIIRLCEICQKPRAIYPSDAKLGRGRYCSKSCATKDRNARRTYKTGWKLSEDRKRKWHEGRDKWMREHPDEVKNFGQRFPNHKGPLSPAWRGGVTKEYRNFHIAHWDELKVWRKQIFLRDGFHCQKCGTNRRLEAHHKIPLSVDKSKAFDLDNGITLCRTCHMKEEGFGHGPK